LNAKEIKSHQHLPAKFRRLHTRVSTKIEGAIKFSQCCSIDEVSRGGMRAQTTHNIPHGELEVSVVNDEGEDLHLVCEQVWTAPDAIGLRLLVPSPEWDQMIQKKLDDLP
jgi:hypothetical protein